MEIKQRCRLRWSAPLLFGLNSLNVQLGLPDLDRLAIRLGLSEWKNCVGSLSQTVRCNRCAGKPDQRTGQIILRLRGNDRLTADVCPRTSAASRRLLTLKTKHILIHRKLS